MDILVSGAGEAGSLAGIEIVRPDQAARARHEQLIHTHSLGNDALLQRVANQLLQHLPVGFNAVWQRITGNRHHALVQVIDCRRRLDLARLQALQVNAFRFNKGIEHIRRQRRIRGEYLIFNDHQMIDRIMAARLQRGDAGVLGIGNQRLHVGVIGVSGAINLDADGGGELARHQHLAHFFAFLNRHHIGGWLIFRDVLVTR